MTFLINTVAYFIKPPCTSQNRRSKDTVLVDEELEIIFNSNYKKVT